MHDVKIKNGELYLVKKSVSETRAQTAHIANYVLRMQNELRIDPCTENASNNTEFEIQIILTVHLRLFGRFDWSVA